MPRIKAILAYLVLNFICVLSTIYGEKLRYLYAQQYEKPSYSKYLLE